MSFVMEKLEQIKSKQRTIDSLLEAGDVKKRNGNNEGWTIDPMYSGEDCDIGFAYIDTVEAGRCPEHIHKESTEYMVVVSGEVVFNMNGMDYRILKEGEVAKIPRATPHNFKPLVDNVKMVYVTIPKDPGMKTLTRQVNYGE